MADVSEIVFKKRVAFQYQGGEIRNFNELSLQASIFCGISESFHRYSKSRISTIIPKDLRPSRSMM